jgi:G3E family GTPase
VREGGANLSRTDETLVEMTNGCICCTLRDDLLAEVDDDRDPAPVAVVQDVVEQRGLAGAEEAGENGDGQAGVGAALSGNRPNRTA